MRIVLLLVTNLRIYRHVRIPIVMDKQELPLDRFSIVLASVSLGLVLEYLIPASTVPGLDSRLIFSPNWDTYSILPVFTAILAGVGSHWIYRANPEHANWQKGEPRLIYHLLLPFFTVLTLAVVLRQMARTPLWWLILGLGIFLFGLILAAEYLSLGNDYQKQPTAVIALIAIAHAFFLVLTIALRTGSARLYLLLPLVAGAAAFVSLRTISLRLQRTAPPVWTLVLSLLVTELAAVLYYIFLSPVQYGLILTGVLFAGNAFVAAEVQGEKKKTALIEMGAVLAALVLIVIFSR